ncbi:MAG: HEAT repeat domain-containing protein [bacterium]
MRSDVKRIFEQLRDEEKCWDAALRLERHRPRGAADALLEMLHEQLPSHTGRCVVWLVGMFGIKEAGKKLVEIMQNRDEGIDVRCGAAFSLGKLKLSDAVGALVDSLREKPLRWSAAHALGRYPDGLVSNILVNSLRDKDAGIREGAVWALAELRSEGAISALEEAAKDEDAAVRRGAEWALLRIEHRRIHTRYRSLFVKRATFGTSDLRVR